MWSQPQPDFTAGDGGGAEIERNAQHTKKRGDQSNQLAKLGWYVGIYCRFNLSQPERDLGLSSYSSCHSCAVEATLHSPTPSSNSPSRVWGLLASYSAFSHPLQQQAKQGLGPVSQLLCPPPLAATGQAGFGPC